MPGTSFFCPICERDYDPPELGEGQRACPADGGALVQLSEHLRPGIVIDGRYTLGRPLGSGGMGLVFRALEHATGQSVAIKLLQSHDTDAGHVRRLLREARASMAIDHDGVIRVYDAGLTRHGVAFMVMEELHGVTLREIISDEAPLEAARAARIAFEVAEALAATHSHGLIHRDLKPSNVFLSRAPEGGHRIKLLDLGLVKAIETDHTRLLTLTGTSHMLGTPVYMSPEQFLGERLSTGSDLYALGCVLYEMLSGRPPFTERTLYELMAAHVHREARPVQQCKGALGLPVGLASLCMELLTKSAADRPDDAAAIAERLRPMAADTLASPTHGSNRLATPETAEQPAIVLETHNSPRAVAPSPLSANTPIEAPPQFRPGLVGRKELRERLENALDTWHSSGEPAMVVLEGPAGVGKSKLSRWFVSRARRYDAAVFSGTHQEAGLGPLDALRQVIERLHGLEGLASADIIERLTVGTNDRINRFEANQVADFLRPDTSRSELGVRAGNVTEDDRLQLLEGALTRVLCAPPTAGPVVLLFEDMRGSRPLTTRFLARLAIALDESPSSLLIVFVVRNDIAWPTPVTPPRVRLHRFGLRPLGSDDMRALIARVLPGADEAVIAHVSRLSGGSPLFAIQLMRHMVACGAFHRSPRGWALRVDVTLGEDDFSALLGARLARLDSTDASARAVLVRIALLGTEVPVSLLEALLEREGRLDLLGALDRHLDRLVLDGWLHDVETWQEDVVAFEHGLLRDALVQRLDSRRASRRLHRLTAEALEHHYTDNLVEHAEAIAYHFERGREHDRALPYAMMTARAASGRHALDEAARRWHRTRELLDSTQAHTDLGVEVMRELAHSLIQIGDHDGAQRVLDALDDHAPDSEALRATLCDARGDVQCAVELFAAAIEGYAASGVDVLAGHLRVNAASAYSKSGDLERAEMLLEQALEIARDCGDRQLEADALNSLSMQAQLRGKMPQAAERLELERALRDTIDDPIGLGRCHYGLGSVAWIQGQSRIALEHYGQAVSVLDEAGHPRGLAHALKMSAACEQTLGRLDAAAACLERAGRLFEALGDKYGQAALFCGLADLHSERGDHEQALRAARNGAALAADVGGNIRVLSVLTLGEVLTASGRHHEALATIDSVLSETSRERLVYERTTGLEARGHALAALGRDDEAYDCWKEALELSEMLGNDEAVASLRIIVSQHARHTSVSGPTPQEHHPMALKYPSTITLTSSASTHSFEDGMTIDVAAGTVSSPVDVTIDETSGQSPTDGWSAVTAAYTVEVSGTKPSLAEALTITAPTTTTVSSSTDYYSFKCTDEMPHPGRWTPGPQATYVNPSTLSWELGSLDHFEAAVEE